MQPRRRIHELVAMYKLEPTVCNVFVEGAFDRNILIWFLRESGVSRPKVIEIERIEVSCEVLLKHGVTEGNKQRVVALACELQALIGPTPQVTCIADTDCDRILGREFTSSLLFYTDYSCMEMYFFDERHLGKLITLVLGNPQPDVSAILARYVLILQELFLIRASLQALQLSCGFLNFTKCCDRTPAGIVMDRDEFINRVLSSCAQRHRMESVTQKIEELRAKIRPDPRHQINGHDFIELLEWDLQRSARSAHLQNQDAVHTALRGCADLAPLASQTLFAKLIERLG